MLVLLRAERWAGGHLMHALSSAALCHADVLQAWASLVRRAAFTADRL